MLTLWWNPKSKRRGDNAVNMSKSGLNYVVFFASIMVTLIKGTFSCQNAIFDRCQDWSDSLKNAAKKETQKGCKTLLVWCQLPLLILFWDLLGIEPGWDLQQTGKGIVATRWIARKCADLTQPSTTPISAVPAGGGLHVTSTFFLLA